MNSRLSIILLVLNVFYFFDSHAQGDREVGLNFASRSEVIGQNGMVASSVPLATQIGLEILKNGGNAIDAAIATNAATGLMEPTGNGIGGDLFALIWHEETQQVYALNASGRSPLNLSYQQLIKELKKINKESIPPYHLLSVSVPGAVDGWFEMHQRFGQMNMDEILMPTIHYAQNGFPVSEAIASAWSRSVPFLKNQPGAFESTFSKNGRGPEKGEIFKNPDLGNTLQLLANQGKDVFYSGEIAEKIDAWMKENNGYLRYEDFKNHQSEWVEPVSTNYRGYEVYQVGGNAQGTAVLQMLNVLEHFNLSATGFGTTETLHALIETKKLVFEDRAKHYTDPDFYDLPYEILLSKEYAKKRKDLISEQAMNDMSTGVEVLEDGDTIFLTTADKEGNMVALIQSNFRGMGTGFVVPGTGFSFQNRGELFSTDPDHANVYAPGKRPFHTIIPGLVTKDGKGWFTYGNMGGGYQPIGHVSILTNIIDFDMNIQEAGDAPRWDHSGSTEPTDSNTTKATTKGKVHVESAIPYQVIRELRAKGHQVEIGNSFFGRYQGIMKDHQKGVYFGASESRVDGQAAGY